MHGTSTTSSPLTSEETDRYLDALALGFSLPQSLYFSHLNSAATARENAAQSGAYGYYDFWMRSAREDEQQARKYEEELRNIVRKTLQTILGRPPTSEEFSNWLRRVTSREIQTFDALSEKMIAYKGRVAGAASTPSLSSRINAIFRSVYGRNPTPSENRYWLSRIKDKPTEGQMVDAMKWHKAAGVRH